MAMHLFAVKVYHVRTLAFLSQCKGNMAFFAVPNYLDENPFFIDELLPFGKKRHYLHPFSAIRIIFAGQR